MNTEKINKQLFAYRTDILLCYAYQIINLFGPNIIYSYKMIMRQGVTFSDITLYWKEVILIVKEISVRHTVVFELIKQSITYI